MSERLRRPAVPRRSRVLIVAVTAGLALAGCGTSGSGGTSSATAASPAPTTSAPPPASLPSDVPVTSPSPDAVETSPSAATGVALTQPWATAQLTDVRSGQPFRIADLVAEGKVVFVEPMAIWCSKCKDQQRAAREAFASLDPAKAVWLGIDVELSESAANLAKYADLNDFPFSYAVSNIELSRALATEFGDVVLSPPSVNVIVVGSDGSVQHMTGHHSPDELVTIAADAGA